MNTIQQQTKNTYSSFEEAAEDLGFDSYDQVEWFEDENLKFLKGLDSQFREVATHDSVRINGRRYTPVSATKVKEENLKEVERFSIILVDYFKDQTFYSRDTMVTLLSAILLFPSVIFSLFTTVPYSSIKHRVIDSIARRFFRSAKS